MSFTNQDQEKFVQVICDEGVSAVEKWLKKGALPNGPDDCAPYLRPLALALSNSKADVAELLVQYGASPRTGANALIDCIDNVELHPWIDRMIADACPEISEWFQDAFLHACEIGNREIAERLLKACPAPAEFTSRRCPLKDSLIAKQTQIALWLIDIGFGPQSHAEPEKPPALYAIVADDEDVLKRLLEAGQPVDQKVGGHQTFFTCIPSLYSRLKHVRDYPKNDKFEVFQEGSLLHVAAVTGSAKCARVLLEAGIDPQAADSEGRTPAMLASIGGENTIKVLQLLPEPDLADATTLTDLITRGLLNGDASSVQKAIDNGFDVSTTVKTQNGTAWTPLTLATTIGNVDVIAALVNAGAELDRSDWTERKRPVLKGIRSLYDHGGLECFVEPASPIDRTALGWAALLGHIDAVKYLLSAGADLSRIDAMKMTALHNAAMGDHSDVVELLVDAGMDLHAEAFDGMTPLHAAAECNAISAVKNLVKLGADPSRLNSRGESPFLAAKESGKPGAWRFLESHTPDAYRKKKRKPSSPPPSLVGGKKELKKIVSAAKKRFGPTAKKICGQATRDRLAQLAESDKFLAVAEKVRRKLKTEPWQTRDDSPAILWTEPVKLTDARLLKLQAEFLANDVFLARSLSPEPHGCRVYLLPTGELFEVLAAFGTHAINFEMHDELLLAWLMDLHDRHPYRLVSVAHDGLEFRFDNVAEDSDNLMRELLTICPPEDHEQEATQWLRKRLKSKTPQPFLWWD